MERTKGTSNQLSVYSMLIDRARLATKLGQQYGGDRDIYQALGYPTELKYADYAARYERQDIAKAIINRPVDYTWMGPLRVLEAKDDKDTPFEKAWEALERSLKLKSKFIRLDKLTCVGHYGVLLLGFDDVRRREDMQQPVAPGNRKLLYIKPIAEGSADIAAYESRTANERFGLPTVYDITLANPGTDKTSLLKVHYTRILHVTSELLESEVKGRPVLKAVYNRLMDLEKLTGGSAEMFWRGARPGFQGKLDKDFSLDKETEEGLENQINEYEHNLRRILLTEGVEFNSLATQVTDPSNHVDIQIQMISAETGIPKRILTGSERGELSSSQDKDAWLEVIQKRREEHAAPVIINMFVERCIEYGVLPKPVTGEWIVDWSDLFAPSEKEKAEVGKTRATALKEYNANPTIQAVVSPEAFIKFFLGLSDEQIDQIIELRDAEIIEEIQEGNVIEETEETEE